MAEPFELDRRGFLKTGGAALALGAMGAGAATSDALAATQTASVAPSPDGSRAIGSDPKTGTSAAVVVDNRPLIHTEQIGAAGASSLKFEINGLLDAVGRQLAGSSSALDQVVKLNFYLTPNIAAGDVERVLAERFDGEMLRPAVSYVSGNLATAGPGVMVDAVATSFDKSEPGIVRRAPGTATLPVGDRIYISGDARPGTVAEATLGTLQSLEQTLKFAGLDWSHAVQLKSFLQPIEAVKEVRDVMKKFFGDRPMPVFSFVEWNSPKLPIEIELIAACPARPERANAASEPLPPVEYLTPPGMTASPVFSRAARVHGDLTIYISGLYGDPSPDAAGRIRSMFTKLDGLLKQTGSDLNHLVKATYYVADEESSKQLNVVRPEFYDPKRPPAASKAMVSGVGRVGHAITMDMIAVPRAAGASK